MVIFSCQKRPCCQDSDPETATRLTETTINQSIEAAWQHRQQQLTRQHFLSMSKLVGRVSRFLEKGKKKDRVCCHGSGCVFGLWLIVMTGGDLEAFDTRTHVVVVCLRNLFKR
jgi:hypothetical protein